ncbi:hypothetical protein OAR17_01550 [Pontimonas sp.]|nr:hypothetical protein [Pontimonas sp.]
MSSVALSRTARGPRVLILVQSGGVEPWLTIEQTAQEKYLNLLFQGRADVVFVQGNPDGDGDSFEKPGLRSVRKALKSTTSSNRLLRMMARALFASWRLQPFGLRRARTFFHTRFAGLTVVREGNRIVLPVPVQIHIAGLRTIETFRFALAEYDFDYVVRLGSTALVIPDSLEAFIESLPNDRVFGGVPMEFGRRSFLSGAALLLSRDVVEKVVEHEMAFPLGVYEDVGLSLLIESRDFADFYAFPRVLVSEPADAEAAGLLSKNVSVIRCKAGPRTATAEPVIANMRAVMAVIAPNFET